MHVDWSLECAVLATSNMYNVPKLEKTNFISATLFGSSHVMFCCLENLPLSQLKQHTCIPPLVKSHFWRFPPSESKLFPH